MFKPISLMMIGLLAAGPLLAQTEPEKAPATKDAEKPPTVKEPGKKAAEQSPPPAAGQSLAAPNTSSDPAAKPQVDKNPPPLDPKNMDTSVKPGDDFYLFANGGWVKSNPVPPEFSRWASFNELAEKNNDALHEICEKAAGGNAPADASKDTKKPAKTSEKPASADVQKVGDFYASGMNESAIDAAKAQPLDESIKRIDAMKDRKDVLKEIGRFHSMGMGAFFFFISGQDDKDSTKIIAQAFQGGLGLPDRDYYTKDDDSSKKIRDQYLEHVTKMLTLAGAPADQAANDAKKIMEMETSLAKPARTRVELRDPQKNYNKMKLAELQALTPDWNWSDYFKELKLNNPGDINVGQPDFFKAANEVFKNTSVDDWKVYLRWHLIRAMAPMLSNDFVNENFRFYEATLRGTKQIKPRWKRVVTKTDDELGEALGKLYVAEKFPPEAKARALEMVNNLKEALADRIKTLDWMDQPTKEQALKKLAAFQVKIGYPEKWRDYSALKIDRASYAQNVMRSTAFEVDRQMKKIGKPVDRTEWGITPPTVNAYYNPNMNEIVFPAGILQPPFFDPKADDAVNYGGMGAVIGHEMTHGFDDQGRQFDAVGNLRDWWTAESAKAYDERRKVVVSQYAAYEPLPNLHINGELTQGENIADIGGVKLAYMAFQKAQAKKGPQPKIDGFTPEQRFFLGYAQIWRNTQRDEDLKLRLNTDPHSPGRFRTIGPLSNFPEFQKAFDIPDGSPMIRPADQRVNIW
ncbi:MAG TPA: M13-type metalloendopeptidase [Chthoniobacterales bacterium]|jgi:putative endopeptidase|nr:M13-type metalloendopeptidase [Chthoniobacterales bacterium]